MEKQIETAFTVVVHTDGTFAVNLKQTGEVIEVQREASSYDVFITLQAIIKELETQMLVDRIVTALNPETTTVPDSIKEKLKERGITPQEPA